MKCEDCIYYVPIKSPTNLGASNGECRRYPPEVSLVVTPVKHQAAILGGADQSAMAVNKIFSLPQVRPDFWCGEFKSRVVPSEES